MTSRGLACAALAACIVGVLGGCASAPIPPSVAPAPPELRLPLALAVDSLPLPAAALPAVLAQRDDEPYEPPEASPRARLDPIDDAWRGDLWARVREGLALPDLDGDLVRKWERYYAERPDYVQRMALRGTRYLFHIVEEIERRGLPLDLALLPFVESAFNPEAMSVAKAAGMWQFMPGTGRDFELKQNLFRDDRRDIIESTRAALDYLEKLHARFNDWHLALAAYNWGQGNVAREHGRNSATGRPTDYVNLRLPDETRNYVPKLQAVKNILRRPEAFGLVLPPLANHPHFVTVAIERDIDVALVSKLAGLTEEQFAQLNPQLNRPLILAAGTPRVLLPYDNANRFVSALADHRGRLASWTAWTAPKTVKPADAARQVGMSEALLREINRIPERMLVKAGSTLLVPRALHQQQDVGLRVANGATMDLAPEAARRAAAKGGHGGKTAAKAPGADRKASGRTLARAKPKGGDKRVAARGAIKSPAKAAGVAKPAAAKTRVAMRQ